MESFDFRNNGKRLIVARLGDLCWGSLYGPCAKDKIETACSLTEVSFCTSMKVNKMHNINLSFVFGLRAIGKRHSAARKLCSDTGKVLDIEVLSKMCKLFLKKTEDSISRECEKHVESSGAMEPVGVYRIFERSAQMRKLHCVQFYGEGDSESFDAVRNVYGENSVTKSECIGHIQKRVGSRLRKLKLKQKGLGGRGKLTDSFIDKLQNYYGIAIRSNLLTLRLGAHMAAIQFNKGFRGLLDVLNQAQVQVGANTEKGFAQLDEERVSESKRHSLSEVKTLRKK
ncbi:uncharacterized protein TNCV_3712321 [Trichonephila clavipes]|nr:uncharacterized protein TNCV_3712321 [Trichonephila clavipes]